MEAKHHHLEQRLYGYMELQVQTGKASVQIVMLGVGAGRCLHISHTTICEAIYEIVSDVALKGMWMYKEWVHVCVVQTCDYLISLTSPCSYRQRLSIYMHCIQVKRTGQ